MVRWVVGLILLGGPIELFLVPASGSSNKYLCLMPYNCKFNVLSTSLYKNVLPSFLYFVSGIYSH